MNILLNIFTIFCFFPYLDLLGLGTDTQPNALLLGALFLFSFKEKKLNLPIILLWVLFLLSILLFFINNASIFLYIKNVLNYLSPPIVAMAAYNLLTRMDYKISFRLFMIIILTYGFVALVQMFIYPQFMTFLLSDHVRGILYGGRGVVSLCPEPAFYGSLCLFLIVFSLITFTKKQNYLAIPILLFQLVFLSRAATAMSILLFALLLFTVFQLVRFKIFYILSVSLCVLLVTPIVISSIEKMEDSRAGNIALQFLEDPFLITKIDESVGVRFTYAVVPFLSMKHSYFKPMGIGHFNPFISKLYREGKYRNFLGSYILKEKARLTGSINMVLFQLGILGMLLPFAIFLAFKRLLHSSMALFALILFISILFTQIQLMHSMIGFIIGYALYLSHLKAKDQTVSII